MAVSPKSKTNKSPPEISPSQNKTDLITNHKTNVDGELVTSWSWGRPRKPLPSEEVYAYKTLPWMLIYALWGGVPFMITG